VLALIYAGWTYAGESWGYREVSVYSPEDIPIYPLKALIPCGAVLLLIQGIAEVVRCVVCLRDGAWPQRLQDVEELESAILHEQEAIKQHETAQAKP
jgi:TRAP-type mannitol/chloroaromatic compound transport system permease small subunit